MKKKNKVGGVTLPEFKTYSKATVNRSVGHWQKKKKKKANRAIEQNREPRYRLYKYSKYIFDKGEK